MPRRSLRDELAVRGPSGAAEVRSALGVSAPTLSRMVAAAGADVLRMGRARATRYALRRPIRGLPARLPVYRVSAAGEPHLVAHLVPVHPRGTWVERVSGDGHLHEGLPPAVVDMAPAGYAGRGFSLAHADLELPSRLQDWSDDHRLIALARRGEDSPGDLIIGDESLDRFLQARLHDVAEEDYPALAVASAAGAGGSSAGGDQPKFAAHRRGRHYLVKFTAGDGSASDSRWRDLLACEAIAAEVLGEAGLPAAPARLVDAGARRFLEVERFDRAGARGRRGVLTLGPIDDDLFGARDSWTDAAARLEATGLLPASDARRIRLLEAFGMVIFNGDRHFGNISFFGDGLEPRPALTLAPAYDTLPMDVAPRAGVLPDLAESLPHARARVIDVWDEARGLGLTFWERVAQDGRIGAEFRRAAARIGRR